MLPPGLPGWRTRSETFDDILRREVVFLSRNVPGRLDAVEFAVEDVPPSDPAPWEGAAPFGRFFPADRIAAVPARVVVYRRPLQMRARTRYELEYLLHVVVCEQLSAGLGIAMTDLDPRWR